MSCTGKSTLSKELEKRIPNSKLLSLDTFHEFSYDMCGFETLYERKELDAIATNFLFDSLMYLVNHNLYEVVLLEYAFCKDSAESLKSFLASNNEISVSTIYLTTSDMIGHYNAWVDRGDFEKSGRHSAHGCYYYKHGITKRLVGNYKNKILKNIETFGDTLTVDVKFSPYTLSINLNDIVTFVTG